MPETVDRRPLYDTEVAKKAVITIQGAYAGSKLNNPRPSMEIRAQGSSKGSLFQRYTRNREFLDVNNEQTGAHTHKETGEKSVAQLLSACLMEIDALKKSKVRTPKEFKPEDLLAQIETFEGIVNTLQVQIQALPEDMRDRLGKKAEEFNLHLEPDMDKTIKSNGLTLETQSVSQGQKYFKLP